MNEPWSMTKEQALQNAGSDPAAGLSQDEAAERRKRFGPNALVRERTITFLEVFKEEITEPMILLLLVVGIFYTVWGELRDSITIFAVIAALVSAEVYTEYRAKKSIAALRKLSPSTASVLRSGTYRQVPAAEIVAGDIIPLEAGDRVPADSRVLDAFHLQVNESLLTGESVPVAKRDRVLPGNTPAAGRSNMVFAGTTVTSGRGTAVVTAIGMDTELGRITRFALEAKAPKTPLQTAMKQLAGLLVWVAVFFSVVIPLIGILQGRGYKEMILTGLSLSFATIPEELPIVITMVLGVGALALSRKHVLVRRLRAAETLGGVTVIVADKTGTITENRMTVAELASNEASTVLPASNLPSSSIALLRAGVLTSSMKKTPDGRFTGDPLEVSLLEAAGPAGIHAEELKSQYKLKEEFSFDNQRKMMSVALEQDGRLFVYAKGAPEVVLAKSSRIAEDASEREKTVTDEDLVMKQATRMAGEAMRVIAFAYKKVKDKQAPEIEEAEQDLVFLGLAGLLDPPRAGVADAVKATGEAGIRTIMVSGDLPLTVQKIAATAGIDKDGKLVTGADLSRLDREALKKVVRDVSMFARINPEQKLQIVQALQETGEVVAVTGDGINDAPALKSADIGVAMGERGTEAAREAADMVLTDDSYNSIVDGVREGRKIFDNLRKGITYYLSVKIALVLSFLVPLVIGLPFPFAPVQIVLLELFMDLAASAGFVAEPMETDAMRRPPRPPKQRFVDREMLTNMSLGAISLAAAVLVNYLLVWYGWHDMAQARTVAFGTWLVGHVFLALTMRSYRQPLVKAGLLSNRAIAIWAGAAFLFFIFITSVPVAQSALKVTYLNPYGWLLIIAVPFVTIFWQELRKLAGRA